MAHSDVNRRGRQNLRFKPGHKIGLVLEGKVVEGTVKLTDGGDWIYPSFSTNSGLVPDWCRSTQVIDLEVISE